MITDLTLKSIEGLYLHCKEKNITLGAVENSPISLLNCASNTPLLGLNTISDQEFFEQFQDSVNRDYYTGENENITINLEDGKKVLPPCSDHEGIHNELKKVAGIAIAELMDYSRNIFRPFVLSVIDGYGEPSTSDVAEKWSIVPVTLNEYYLDPVVSALLDTYADIASMPWDGAVPVNDIVIPDELPMPETGRSSFDKLVKNLLDSMSMSPSHAMQTLFTEELINPHAPRAWVKAPLVLAQFLLVNYYENEPWENSNVNSIAFEAAIGSYKNNLAGWLGKYLTNLGELIDSETMVIDVNEKDKEVYIIEDVYKKFISENAGTPEVIYGALYMISSGGELKNFSRETFVERSADCIRAWEAQHAIQEESLNANWQHSARNHMKQSFSLAIDSLDEELIPDDTNKQTLREEASELIDKLLDRYSMDDPTLLVIDIAGQTVFKHTDAGWVMREVHRLMSEGLTGGRAERQVTIRYALNWILSGVYVSK